jgi:hypothetical protein
MEVSLRPTFAPRQRRTANEAASWRWKPGENALPSTEEVMRFYVSKFLAKKPWRASHPFVSCVAQG